MNDWNRNGKYDMSDSFTDYHLANGGGMSGSSSGLVEMGIACNCSGSMSTDRDNYFTGDTDFWVKEWYIVERVRI